MSSQVFADSPRHIITQSVHVRGSNQRSTFLVIAATAPVKVYLIVIGYEFSVDLRQVTVKAAECRLAGG